MMGGIYIAGPECFLPNGYALWWSARKLAESKGFAVTMPTATPLKQDAAALRDNAREIFDDLLIRADESDTIIADLRSFRGPEPDGGTIFEMGMMKARGARLYGYDLTLMSVVERNPYAVFSNGTVFDEKGFPYPYASLPFPPAVYALSTLIEGDFGAALSVYAEDMRKKSMGIQLPDDIVPAADPDPDKVFFSSWRRYDPECGAYYAKVSEAFSRSGLTAVFPSLPASWEPAAVRSAVLSDLEKIASCGIFAADLNDFRGYEPSGDVSFESGYAFGLGRKCFGFMEDDSKMRSRIPNIDGLDAHGHIIENFDYPINLMFSCSMPIIKASADNPEEYAEAISQAR